ncbi:MAG: cytochrome c3 family protein [Myxococcota bacterium]
MSFRGEEQASQCRSQTRRLPEPPSALVILLLAASPLAGAAEPPETLALGASCVDAGCHAELGALASPHWEALSSECARCHISEGDAHAFELEEGPELCLECHDPMTDGAVVHEPAEDDCLDCHDPHGSPVGALLTEDSELDLCLGCHDEELIVGRHRHEPVANGECSACHDPHSSDNERLLLEEGSELCALCHEEITEAVASLPYVHDPVEEGCTECHTPHSGPFARLLEGPFPRRFYVRFSPERYGLCFDCHDEELATLERTRTATEFRDGALNLHFVHVNHRKRGRSCRACHDVHASARSHQLREWVPYGSWKLPIRFRERPAGGSCRPGCHEPQRYSRTDHDRVVSEARK